MQYRLKDEYKVETIFEPLSFQCSAWISGDMSTFEKTTTCQLVKDKRGNPMALFTSQWEKDYCIKQNPNHKFIDVLV